MTEGLVRPVWDRALRGSLIIVGWVLIGLVLFRAGRAEHVVSGIRWTLLGVGGLMLLLAPYHVMVTIGVVSFRFIDGGATSLGHFRRNTIRWNEVTRVRRTRAGISFEDGKGTQLLIGPTEVSDLGATLRALHPMLFPSAQNDLLSSPITWF